MEQELTESQSTTEVIEKPELDNKVDWQHQIVLASLKLFAEKGFFNTSVTEIAEQAGLKSTNSLYQHFKNKQAIAAYLYGHILDSLNVSIDDIRRKSPKASEQLRGIVDLLFKLTDDAPDVMQFLLALNIEEIIPEEKPLLESAAFIKIQKIFQAGITAGEIRKINPLLINAYFFGIINNTLRMVLSGSLKETAQTYQAQVWLSAWNVIAKNSAV